MLLRGLRAQPPAGTPAAGAGGVTRARRWRRCPWCGLVARTTAFVLVDPGLPIRQHGWRRRRCPGCAKEGRAWTFAVVRAAVAA
jgi:hypothetical protein